MAANARRFLFNASLTIPPVIFFTGNFYTLHRVADDDGPMEPTLRRGDVLLVRRSDVYPCRLWKEWTTAAFRAEEGEHDDDKDSNGWEEESRNALRVMALDAQAGSLVGDSRSGRTYLSPPMVHQLGTVVVFRAPDARKHPTREWRVRRVVALGGQVVFARTSENNDEGYGNMFERVPPYSLWVEGDNCNYQESNEDGKNRDDQSSGGIRSIDSRTWGPVSKNCLIGIAERIVWPPSRWGAVPRITPAVPRSWWE